MNDQRHLANIQKEMAENPPETSHTFKEFKILGLENPQAFVDKLVEIYGDKVFMRCRSPEKGTYYFSITRDDYQFIESKHIE